MPLQRALVTSRPVYETNVRRQGDESEVCRSRVIPETDHFGHSDTPVGLDIPLVSVVALEPARDAEDAFGDQDGFLALLTVRRDRKR